MRILRVAGAQPLEQSVGVASAHSAIADGRLADPRLERALTTMLQSLVEAEPQAA